MSDPFQRLLELESLCVERAAALPAIDTDIHEWVGVGFNLGDTEYVSKMGEVVEILDLPQYTKVPGVKSWVIGIANVRGSLLPLMDLKGFIDPRVLVNRKQCRVLVVRHKGTETGLVVDGVTGLKHFSLDEQTSELPKVDAEVKPFIKNAFQREEQLWPVFSLYELVDDERFLHASL
ncbi:MAG: chemotaxis protein CheW [Gammaproteobacteria bacterium]|nr:chemotaxis protein CheW [Gammaproteobacteria bacterium]